MVIVCLHGMYLQHLDTMSFVPKLPIAWIQVQAVTRGSLSLKSSRLSLSTFQKVLGIDKFLFAHLRCVPCLCDVRFILFFLGMSFAVEGFDRLQQMLLKLREPLV